MSISVPGNICDTRNDIMPTRRPGNLKREKAYAAVQERKTPAMVLKTATTVLLRTQRANGWSVITETKFEADQCSGKGMTARSRSLNCGSAGRSAMARLCLPEKAMLMTHSTG